MKFIIRIFYVFLISISLNALDVGSDAPPIVFSEIIKGQYVKLPSSRQKKTDDGEKFFVVYFWATWLTSAPHLLDFVEREQNLYKNDAVFIGITKENEKIVRPFLQRLPDFNLNLLVDNKASTYNKYMLGTEGVPLFFIIDSRGRVLYKCSPIEFDRVFTRILSGSFDIQEQEKIELIRKELRTASMAMNKGKILSEAEEILKIDPIDETSLNILVENYIRENKYQEALDLIHKSRKNALSNKYSHRALYLIEFGIIRDIPAINNKKEALAQFVRDFNCTFQNSPEELNEILTLIIADIPFVAFPLEDLLKMAKNSVLLEKNARNNPDKLSKYLSTMAKIYYYANMTDMAIELQDQALKLKSDSGESSNKIYLNFYREIQKLQNQKKQDLKQI